MGAIAILSSWTAITERVKEYYIFLLVLQTGMIGVFVALDFLLFFVFWEVMLVPMYFLIGIWGGGRRLYAAIKFFLYTLVGSVVMLLGILALYFYNALGVTGRRTPSTSRSSSSSPCRLTLQNWIFLAFFLGFAIKVPMFPFHTWLPDAHTEAPTAGSVILAGVLLKMGTYGFIRFSLPILPEASRALRADDGRAVDHRHRLRRPRGPGAEGLEAARRVFVRQPHGFVMLGHVRPQPGRLTGSILQKINHGISTGALFLIVGIVYERRHTRAIAEYGGLSKVMPVFAAVFLVMTCRRSGCRC